MNNRTIVNIPDPHNEGCRIVGFRLEECDEALGDYGLSEPLSWFENKINAGIKNHAGQQVLVRHILETDQGLSETTRQILSMFIGE